MSSRRMAGSAVEPIDERVARHRADGLDEPGQRDPVHGVDRFEQLGHVGANGRIGVGLEPGDQPLGVLQDVAARRSRGGRLRGQRPPSGPRGSRAAALASVASAAARSHAASHAWATAR